MHPLSGARLFPERLHQPFGERDSGNGLVDEENKICKKLAGPRAREFFREGQTKEGQG